MTAPDAAGRARPLRIAGLALLGLAVGALLVGLVTLGSQDGDDGGGAAGATSNSAAPGGAATSTDTSATPAPAPVTTTPAPPPPPPVTTAAPTPAPLPPPPPPPSVPVRVYNNSTVRGLAQQAADDFGRDGWQVAEVANYPNARIPTSTVYFRPGTDEEAAAQRLGTRFNLRVEPRFEGIVGASPGLIVIVTNDYGSK